MKSPLTSNRMTKLIAALRGAGKDGLTPIEINQACNSTRASSDISELRQNGVAVAKTYRGKSPNGRMVYAYILVPPTGG